MVTPVTRSDTRPGPGPGPGRNPATGADPLPLVARAIDWLVAHADAHPDLDALADVVGLSPQHFQRVFKAGAGVSPKRFLQYLAAGEARRTLDAGGTVLDAAYAAGLSGPARLHDLFLVAEAMTPGAYKRRGEGETVRHAHVPSPFGAALLGATDKGVCWLSFEDAADPGRGLREMKADWPMARFVEDEAAVAPLARRAFAALAGAGGRVGLHVQGTNFQLKVWEALLRIPEGETVTYGEVAAAVGAPRAVRAVGAAVGANRISMLIPCHRVIRASGAVHNYRWGPARKRALLALEAARRAG